jgi:arabinofuranosyltransferase
LKADTHNWSRLALTALVLLFGVETLLFIGWIPDDAFICFRYAANLADGAGPVFNAGDRVEGASNPLWTVLLGLLSAAGLETVRTAVVLSLLCAVCSVVLAWKLFEITLSPARGKPGDPETIQGEERHRFLGLRTVLTLGLIASLPMVFYASSGLETHAELMFLLLGSLYHLKARADNNQKNLWISQFAFLSVALLRPEGILFLLLGAGFIVAGGRNAGGIRKRWPVLLIPLVLFVLALLLKAMYYDSFVPNTYLAKPGASLVYLTPLWRGLTYLVRFFLVSGLVLMLPFCAIAFSENKRRYSFMFLSAVVLVQLGFIVLVGGDVLRFDRFAVPFTPFLLAVALIGFVRLDGLARVRSRRLPVAGAVICVLLMAGLNGGRIYLALNKLCLHDWMNSRVHREVGLFLKQALSPGASVVTNEVGAIAYESGLDVYDMIGLTDATVGKLLYESYQRFGVSGSSYSVPRISAYLMSKEPDCVILPAYGRIDPEDHRPVGDLMHPIWQGLFVHPELAEFYRCSFHVKINENKYWYFYFRLPAEHGQWPAGGPGPGPCQNVEFYAADRGDPAATGQ